MSSGFLIHVFSHVVFITTYYNSMDGKMQCLYVSSFMEIFGLFLGRRTGWGDSPVGERTAEIDGWTAAGQKAFDFLPRR